MCRFNMTTHVRERNGPRGLVKKPTGFITSSRCIAAQLDAKCDGTHSHVHLVGGRAAGAQVYPEDLCRAILRGVVRQKAMDAKQSRVVVPPMSAGQISSFIRSLSGVEIGSVREFANRSEPIGKWPKHWVDHVHEADGGMDVVGSRPQRGIEILQAELDMLPMRNGMTYANDDVSGEDLLPEWVVLARQEEIN